MRTIYVILALLLFAIPVGIAKADINHHSDMIDALAAGNFEVAVAVITKLPVGELRQRLVETALFRLTKEQAEDLLQKLGYSVAEQPVDAEIKKISASIEGENFSFYSSKDDGIILIIKYGEEDGVTRPFVVVGVTRE